MTPKAVAWDIDGTLIDSEPLHLRALLDTCAGYGVDISDLPDDTFVGVNLHGVWAALAPRFPAALTKAEWAAAIDGHYRAGCDSLVPLSSAAEVVRRIDALGLRQVAVSNSNRAVVDANLGVLGIAAVLDFSLSLDDVPVGKPDPTPYRLAAERLGLAPEEVVVVEDSRTGVAAGCAAGCFTVGLAAEPQALPQADRTIIDLGELPAVLAERGAAGACAATARAD